MKRYWQVLSVLMTGFFLSSVYADNLIQIYNQALIKDPIFEQNNAFLALWHAELAGYTKIPSHL